MHKLCFAAADGLEYIEMLDLIKAAGFEGYFTHPYIACEVDKMRKVKEHGDSLGLYCETSHSVMAGCMTIWEDGSDGDQYIETLKGNLDNCAALDIPILIVHIKPDLNGSPCFERGIERLKKLVAYAADKNIKIAFENINNEEYLIKTLDVFKEPHVGFCLDVGHESCNTPGVEFLPQIGDRLFCTHIHDNDGFPEDKVVDHKSDHHKIPFDGSIDFTKVCKDIKDCNFSGTLMLEVSSHEPYDFYKDLTPEQFYGKAFEAAKKLRNLTDGE